MDVREIRTLTETFPDVGTKVWLDKNDVVEWLQSLAGTYNKWPSLRPVGEAMNEAANALQEDEDCE